MKQDVLGPVEWLQDEVVQLKAQEQTLVLKEGQQVKFDQLLIATGGMPKPPDIPGKDLAGVLRNRDIDVTVVARHPLPFASQFGEEIGRHFYDLHSSNGVKFVEGEPEALTGEGAVSGVRLKGGKTVAAS